MDRATQFVERDELSAAVLDFGLRGGDANGLCARLNERYVPYVLHSGYSHLGDQCHRGVVVPKSANPSALIDALLRLLGGPNGANHQQGELAPDRLKVLGNAFDEAWQTIARNIAEAPAEIDRARTTLANVILSLPSSQIADAESINNAALRVMAGPHTTTGSLALSNPGAVSDGVAS